MTIEAVTVSHSFGAREALSDVTLALHGGVTALVGVNGAGKSTLLRAMAGCLAPTRGMVLIGGHDLYGGTRADRSEALRQVALMPQLAEFPAGLTVFDVVSLVGWLRGLPRKACGTRAHEVIEGVGLASRSNSRIKELSGGMLRRVALAQAMVSEPDVLLLDEPSTGLDPAQRRAMLDLVKGLDTTILFSSHVIEDVRDVASRIVVLDDGRIVFSGSQADLASIGEAIAGTSPGQAAALEAGFLRIVSGAARP